MACKHASLATRSRRPARPRPESLEGRQLLAVDTGAVVTGLVIRDPCTIVVSFSEPLDQASAQDSKFYRVSDTGAADPRVITLPGQTESIRSVVYDATTVQVTIGLAHPLDAGHFYRVRVDGTPLTGLAGSDGTTFDGDQTAGGDFYGLAASGTQVKFADINGDVAGIRVSGGGRAQAWRDLDGNVHLMMQALPSIQSAVSAQSGGKWLVFGGRTNGLHAFDCDGLAGGDRPGVLPEGEPARRRRRRFQRPQHRKLPSLRHAVFDHR
jgi:hypothetical protein